MDKIKTSELISKFALASEEACKCEDEKFLRVLTETVHKKEMENVTYADVANIARAVTDFSRFSSMRAMCKVLQELDIIENDVDVFNNDDFRKILAKAFNVEQKKTALTGSLSFCLIRLLKFPYNQVFS